MSQNADRRFAPNAVAARSAMHAILLGIAFLPGCTSANALDEASPGVTPYNDGGEPGGAEEGVASGPDAMPGLGSDATAERGPEPGALAPGALRPPASGRRLVRNEYLNTVGDLFAIDTEPLRDILIDDGGASGFRNAFTALLPSGPRTDAFEQAAIYVAEAVPPATLARYVACLEAAEPCTSDFVAALGRVLYRRPLV
jgi:hypothetical protein